MQKQKHFVKSEDLLDGEIIRISKRKGLSTGKIKAPNEKEKGLAQVDRSLMSKSKSVLDLH